MSLAQKVLSALSLALLIAFGSFAVSLAQDLPSSGPRHPPQGSGVLKTGPAQLDRYTLSVAMDSETDGLSNSLSPESEVHRVIYFHHVEPHRLSIANRPYAAKVSLQLLDLVLLI